MSRVQRVKKIEGDRDSGLQRTEVRHIFHRDHELVACVEGRESHCLLRADAGVLSQLTQGPIHCQVSHFVIDEPGSVLAVQRSEQLGLLAYTVYGYAQALEATSIVGFNGAYPEIETRQYPLGAGKRFYSPMLMRFSSPDFFSPFLKGGVNAYAYCTGDPVNKIDPSGESGRFLRGGSHGGTSLQPKSPPAIRALINARVTARSRPSADTIPRAVENTYSATPKASVEMLMDRHKINRSAASMVHGGVPLEIIKRSIANKLPLGANFIQHAKLPESFLVSGVDKVLSTGESPFIATYRGEQFYFTISDNGLNLRDSAQWLAKQAEGLRQA